MGPPAAPAAPQIVYRNVEQPTREDPAIAKAKADELRRQQQERGRMATLIVGDKATGEALLPSGPGGAAQLGS